MSVEEVVIIGSGPAGYTAAIYSARAGNSPLMITGFLSGGQKGGQLMTTTEVENFPGFPDGITGPELMEAMESQAKRYGTREIQEDVVSIDFTKSPFVVRLSKNEILTKSVIICTGATARLLDIPGHNTYWQKGISACAVCDGALPIFRNKPSAVIGGGDTACEEALFMTKYSSKVHLIVRRDEFRASKTMADRVKNHEKIEIHYMHQIKEVKGDKFVKEIILFHSETKEEKTLQVDGLFYALGHVPNTGFLNGSLETDKSGYIVVKPKSSETSVPGVFAAGDVIDKTYRQAVTAAGMGCMAALDVDRWLGEIK